MIGVLSLTPSLDPLSPDAAADGHPQRGRILVRLSRMRSWSHLFRGIPVAPPTDGNNRRVVGMRRESP